LDRVYPEGIRIPEYFQGKNIVHLPTVKCIAGDTEIVLADGSVETIRDVVSRQIEEASSRVVDTHGETSTEGRVDLLAMSESGEVKPFAATWFWQTKPRGRRILRLRTRTGRTLVATEDHCIHTPDGWKALGDLKRGMRVGIARRLRLAGASQWLPQTYARVPD